MLLEERRRIFNKVVLPEPEDPTIPKKLPGAIYPSLACRISFT